MRTVEAFAAVGVVVVTIRVGAVVVHIVVQVVVVVCDVGGCRTSSR